MAIRSEVFGSCVGGIDVSVEIGNRAVWLCCGWKYMGFNLRGKRLKIGGGNGGWCQVLEGILGALGVIKEIKSPCGGRGFLRDRIIIQDP